MSKRYRISIVSGAFLMLFLTVGPTVISKTPDSKAAKYSGYKNCVKCHEKMDDSVKVWKSERHSKAFESLATADAKKFSSNPQKDKKCLKCHVTGLDKPGGYSTSLTDKENETLKGVTCQSCHGAGQNYLRAMITANKDKKTGDAVVKSFEKAGLIVKPNEKSCKACHNEECPTSKNDFKFDEMMKKVKHGKKLK